MTAPVVAHAHSFLTGLGVPSSPIPPRILTIAGTDPTGGAGTAADTKSIQAAGGFAMNVTTAVVSQNTTGVQAVHTVPANHVRSQLDSVLDVTIDAVKTGMLGTAELVGIVLEWLDVAQPEILVVDPVMVASSGDRLLDDDAVASMRELCSRATVITPNLDELAVLTQCSVAATEDDALAQGRAWAEEKGVAVIVKTGHLDSPWATNHWVYPGAETVSVPTRRVDTTSTHGTGCSLAAALTTRLAMGVSPDQALAWSTDWLHESISNGKALQVGQGYGPVDHNHQARRLTTAADTSPWLQGLFGSDHSAFPLSAFESVETLEKHLAEQPVNVPEATVASVGPWTSLLWKLSAALTDAIQAAPFVQDLVAGTLPLERFRFYLGQDALYLGNYSRALATVGAKAPENSAQIFWAESSRHAVETESAMHREFLNSKIPPEPGPVTSHYCSYLTATCFTQDYVVAAAAVLPCFWLYAHVGGSVSSQDIPANHPYATWLATYGDEEFAEGVRGALTHVEAAFAQASATGRRNAVIAYLNACRHELEFFDQALRIPVGAVR